MGPAVLLTRSKAWPSTREQPFINTPSPQVSTTATDTTLVHTAVTNTPQVPGLPVLSPPALPPDVPNQIDLVGAAQTTSATMPKSDSAMPLNSSTGQIPNGSLQQEAAAKPQGGLLSARAPRNNASRSISAQRRLSTPSQKSFRHSRHRLEEGHRHYWCPVLLMSRQEVDQVGKS